MAKKRINGAINAIFGLKMLTSLALIFLLGLLLGSIFLKLKLPSILGMILTGIILGPHVLNLLRPAFLDISADLRQLALVIILTRAGLTLDIHEFKRIGRSALLMCFVPATVEILGVVVLAPPLMGVTYWEAALMGSAIAAVCSSSVAPALRSASISTSGRMPSTPSFPSPEGELFLFSFPIISRI